MNAILLNGYDKVDEHIISVVYCEKARKELNKIAGLDFFNYTKDDIAGNPQKFKDVKYIFSTWGMPTFNEKEIEEYFPNLECVFYAAGTVQSFARPFLNKGKKVFSAWGANAEPVAEYAAAQIILAGKGFFGMGKITSRKDYEGTKDYSNRFAGNYNTKVGIIGAGMIGKAVIKKLKDYKLEFLVFDPFLPDETAYELGVKKVTLSELFKSCNVISNHLANNEKTRGMIDYSCFSSMPPYSTFINTGRGAQVNENDLCRILSERADITAVLDVTEPEPPKDGSLLYTLPNCVLTPHIAGSSGREVERLCEYMLNEYKKYSAGEPTQYEITLKMLETMA